jgi:hypothetical protein
MQRQPRWAKTDLQSGPSQRRRTPTIRSFCHQTVHLKLRRATSQSPRPSSVSFSLRPRSRPRCFPRCLSLDQRDSAPPPTLRSIAFSGAFTPASQAARPRRSTGHRHPTRTLHRFQATLSDPSFYPLRGPVPRAVSSEPRLADRPCSLNFHRAAESTA